MSNTRKRPETRSTEDRESTKRVDRWSNSSVLPVPDERDGYSHRWVRTAVVGHADNGNVSTRFRDGWEPIKRSEYPEFKNLLSDIGSRWEGEDVLEIGGLILCRTATENVEARTEHYSARAQQQVESVDRQLRAAEDPRMPMDRPLRKTTVGDFGSGDGR